MAKEKKVFVPKYPSQFGSHTVMVDEEATKGLSDDSLVVCIDEHGAYQTSRKSLDNGLADPRRFNGDRQLLKKADKPAKDTKK